MNLRPSGYEPDELPGCSTPRRGFWLGPAAVFGSGRRASAMVHGPRPCAAGGLRLRPHFKRPLGRMSLRPVSVVLGAGRPFGGGEVWKRKRFEALVSDLCRPGDDLLSHVLRQSTIGAKAFDGRVRDGIGSDRLARATRPAKDGFRTTEDGRQRTESDLCRLVSDVWRPNEAKLVCCRRLTAETKTAGRSVLCHPSSERALCARARALATRAIKSNERLVPVSYARCRASTSGLSTWWSSTALQGELVLRLVSRLDAFSGYPFHI